MTSTPDGQRRLASLDLLRGAVMVLMVIDHVRVFSGLPAGGATAGLFFTRWVTHFCAPAFVFFAGTSAFLYGRAHAQLSRFLLTRGAWLVLLELTVLRLAWTFNFDVGHVMAGVIWVLGWSMVLLAGLCRLPRALLGVLSVALIAGHNLLDAHVRALTPTLGADLGAAAWKLAYVGFFAGPVRLGEEGPSLLVLYSLVPWVGVLAAGYVFGPVMTLEPARRRRLCLALGLGATALFIALRALNGYGDPNPWSTAAQIHGQPLPAGFSFLNTTKYPPRSSSC